VYCQNRYGTLEPNHLFTSKRELQIKPMKLLSLAI
jgi:hypothetical protein